MASPVARAWIVAGGVVLLLVQAALVLAWWLLPRWQPVLVATYSPWPEPALRALRYDDSPIRRHGFAERLVEFGPAIGPQLLRQYGGGDSDQRMRMLVLANGLIRVPGMGGDDGSPPAPFTRADVATLHEQLVELARLAFAERSLGIGETAAFLAVRLKDRRLTPLMCDLLVGLPTPIGAAAGNVAAALGALGDPRAVATLIPLLPIRHRTDPDVEQALAFCQDDSTFPLVLAALRHAHPVVRTWGAHQLPRYLSAVRAGPAWWTVVAARRAVAGAELLALSGQDDDLFAQLAQIEVLGTIGFSPAGAHLRSLTAHADTRLPGVAID